MSPPTTRGPRAIPGVVEEDVTPAPHDLGAGAQRAWDHAEAIGRRVAVAVGDQLEELGAQLAALREERKPAPPPAPAPPSRPIGPFLQVISIAIVLLGAAFVLYQQIGKLGERVEALGERQRQSDEDTQRRLDRLDDRLYDQHAAPSHAAAPVGP
jgi:hypothetical protein